MQTLLFSFKNWLPIPVVHAKNHSKWAFCHIITNHGKSSIKSLGIPVKFKENTAYDARARNKRRGVIRSWTTGVFVCPCFLGKYTLSSGRVTTRFPLGVLTEKTENQCFHCFWTSLIRSSDLGSVDWGFRKRTLFTVFGPVWSEVLT